MSDTTYTWYQSGNYAKFRVQNSIYGLFVSYDDEGTQLVTALTEEICLYMTPFHQKCNAPDYDGSHDIATHNADRVVDL